MGLDDSEPGHPVESMTKFQYWRDWILAGGIALLLARWILVQPILDAILKVR